MKLFWLRMNYIGLGCCCWESDPPPLSMQRYRKPIRNSFDAEWKSFPSFHQEKKSRRKEKRNSEPNHSQKKSNVNIKERKENGGEIYSFVALVKCVCVCKAMCVCVCVCVCVSPLVVRLSGAILSHFQAVTPGAFHHPLIIRCPKPHWNRSLTALETARKPIPSTTVGGSVPEPHRNRSETDLGQWTPSSGSISCRIIKIQWISIQLFSVAMTTCFQVPKW